MIGTVADVRLQAGVTSEPLAYVLPGEDTRTLTVVARVRAGSSPGSWS